jgi:hypothetical protein
VRGDQSTENTRNTGRKRRVAEILGLVRGRRADDPECGPVSGGAAERAGRCVPGAAAAGVYENYIGSIIDWYGATLFRREPVLAFEGGDERGRAFYNEFAEDCDLRGSTLSEFFRRQVVNALVMGKSYVVVDFPRIGRMATTRAEEDELGMSRAYLCEYPAASLINGSGTSRASWSGRCCGRSGWCGRRTARRGVERRWIRYDRRRSGCTGRWRAGVERRDRAGGRGAARAGGERRVPVFEFSVGEGLWLMNKAASLQLEHFNKSNGLSWALTMGLFAMPVVYSDRKFEQLVGDSVLPAVGAGRQVRVDGAGGACL